MDGLYWKTLLKWMIWGYHYFWKHPNSRLKIPTDVYDLFNQYLGYIGWYSLVLRFLIDLINGNMCLFPKHTSNDAEDFVVGGVCRNKLMTWVISQTYKSLGVEPCLAPTFKRWSLRCFLSLLASCQRFTNGSGLNISNDTLDFQKSCTHLGCIKPCK